MMIRWFPLSLVLMILMFCSRLESESAKTQDTSIPTQDGVTYKASILEMIKNVRQVFDDLQALRKGKNEHENPEANFEAFEAFANLWLKSWTGVPLLAVDYIKHWLSSDAEAVAQFALMKRESENLARHLASVLGQPSKARREALMKTKLPQLRRDIDALVAQTQKVFRSGYIHECLKQLDRLMDAQSFMDLSQLPLTRVNAVLHLLGKPLPKDRIPRDEL